MAPSTSTTASTAPQIKGYLPVRLILGEKDETFFYIREHHQGSNKKGSSNANCTLFVANAPIVPGISTKIVLQSLLGRYADIGRVTVISNPRQTTTVQEELITTTTATTTSSSSLVVGASWSKKVQHPSFLPPIYSEGKYAHVVFTTHKGMKRTLNALHDVMKKNKTALPAGLTLERLEIQTLSDESTRQYKIQQQKLLGKFNNDNDDDNDDIDHSHHLTGVLAVAHRYRASLSRLSRAELLEECNNVMAQYEQIEEETQKAHIKAKTQPDEDGFITVSYSSSTTKADGTMEEGITSGGAGQNSNSNSGGRRRGAGGRNRKKKKDTT
eukprot:scaffold3448_cov92-Cylindrotheca_fusiformis.AAC.5